MYMGKRFMNKEECEDAGLTLTRRGGYRSEDYMYSIHENVLGVDVDEVHNDIYHHEWCKAWTEDWMLVDSTISKSQEYLKMHKSITDKMYSIAKAKNADYTGKGADPYSNFRAVEVAGITTAQGFFTRMTDKYMRLAGFIKNGTLEVKDESVEDTLLDLANYCILMVCEMRDK
jgi:hypothetical protein